MNRKTGRLLSMALFIVLLAVMAVCVWDWREDLAGMLRLSPDNIAGMLLLALGGCLMNCVYHLIILRTYGLPLSLTDWMGVVSVSNAMAYALPLRADLVFTAAYYKRVKGLAYTKSASMAGGNIVFGVAFSLLQILAGLLCTGLIQHEWPGLLWGLLLAGTAALAAFVVLALVFQNRLPAFLRKHKLFLDVMEGFTALLRNRPMLLRLLVCMVVNNLFQLFLYKVCFQAAGMPIPLYGALFYSGVSWLINIVAIVPGNIGIKESVIGAATAILKAGFQVGVAASLLQRVAVMVIHLVLGLVFAFPVYARMRAGTETAKL